jgi:hypothetical protein
MDRRAFQANSRQTADAVTKAITAATGNHDVGGEYAVYMMNKAGFRLVLNAFL